jgi:serine/threonine protein kinase
LLDGLVGREAQSGRKVAIKKIKVGQFKDGLDMSAIREVKYLRELHHQNVIEVCSIDFYANHALIASAFGRLLVKDQSKFGFGVLRFGLGNDYQRQGCCFSTCRHKELDGNDTQGPRVLPQEFCPSSSTSAYFFLLRNFF